MSIHSKFLATEKCKNCKGIGSIVIGSKTVGCLACKGNGVIASNTMKDYFG
jgi:DnaJ-class molecular chaperone